MAGHGGKVGILKKIFRTIHDVLKPGTGVKFSDGDIYRVQQSGAWQRERSKAIKGKAAVKAAKKARRLNK